MSHRNWGLAGISLFTLVICSVLAGQMAVIKTAEAQGFGDAARRFSAVALCALPLMAGIFVLAIANSRRPQIHKRWMVLLMSAMARAMATMAHTVDSSPLEMPARTVVAGPVRPPRGRPVPLRR